MKKHFVVLLLVLSTISVAEDKIKFGIGSSNQRVNDISFEFSTKKGDLIRMQIDQITSKGQNIAFEIKDVNYFDYLKWLTGLSSAEMRGFNGIVIISDENIDFKASIERTYFEIKNIDLLIDDERVDLNSLDINYKLTNLEFSVPYFNESEIDEFINTIIPDGKIPKVEFSISYNKIDKTLDIDGTFRMLSGNGIIDISVMINENDMALTYVENSSLKLNNLADGLVDYINNIEDKTNFSITKLGRGSFKIEYSGLLKNIPSQDIFIQSKVAHEQGVIIQIVDGLETWGMEEFMDTGIKSWPDNPFQTLATISFDYREGKTDMTQLSLGEWIFTGVSELTYDDISLSNAIVHRGVEDSLSVWIYDPSDGSVSHGDTPYLPFTKIYIGERK